MSLKLFSHRAGDGISSNHAIETGHRGVSRPPRRRLIRLPLNPGECGNWCAQHAFLVGKKAEETTPRKSTPRTLKLGRLRARSFRPFLPAPRRTGLDTCRIIRLSSFLVSLTLAS